MPVRYQRDGIVLEFDAEPSDDELDAAFASESGAQRPESGRVSPHSNSSAESPRNPANLSAAGLGLNVDAIGGALKGAGRSVLGGAQALGGVLGIDTPGIQRLRGGLAPKNSDERAGQTIEQILEYAVPGAKAKTLLGRAAKGALGQGAVATAQAGEVGEDTASAAKWGAAGPVAEGLLSASGRFLRGRAQGLLEQVLAPTGKRMKDKVGAAASQMLDEGGIVGSRKSLATRMQGRADAADKTRKGLEAAAAGDLVDTAPIRRQLEAARDRLKIPGTAHSVEVPTSRTSSLVDESGRPFTIEGSETHQVPAMQSDSESFQRLQSQIDKLEELEAAFGSSQVPREALLSLKQGISPGVYERGNPGGLPGSEQRARKTLVDSAADTLNDANKDIAAANERFTNRKNAAKMLQSKVTADRGKPGSKVGEFFTARRALGSLAGAGIGSLAGGPLGAVAGAVAPLTVLRVIESPVYKTLSATAQNYIGRLLRSGQTEVAVEILSRLGASGGGDRAVSTVGEEADADPSRLPVTDADLEFERRMQR